MGSDHFENGGGGVRVLLSSRLPDGEFGGITVDSNFGEDEQ